MVDSATHTLYAHLKSKRDACLRLVEELVRIESYATQTSGVDAVGDFLCGELEAVGYETERVRGERLPLEERWVEELFLPGFDWEQLADHRIARKRGSGTGRVLILGDMDSACPPGALERFPFRVEGPRAYGPGIADMKGGLAVTVHALQALAETSLENLAEVTVVLSADEQAGSFGARTVIETAAREADWVFCMECARNGARLMNSHIQLGVGILDVHGRDAHAGSAFDKGISAIEAMSRKITAIHALTDRDRGIFLNVGTVAGGWRRNVIAGHCRASLDVRAASAADWDAAAAAVGAIAAREDLPGSTADLRLLAYRPALPRTADTDRLLAIARDAGAAFGLEVAAAHSPAAGSSAFCGPLGVPCLDGMGPVGIGTMTLDEHIEVPSLVERAALLAATMHALGCGAWSRGGPGE